QRMFWLILALTLVYGLAMCWLLVSRRRLAIKQAQQRRSALEAKAAENHEEHEAPKLTDPVAPDPHDTEVDISSINLQTQTVLRGAMIVAALTGFWLVWVDVIPALKILDHIRLWSTTVTINAAEPSAATQAGGAPTTKVVWITLGDLLLSLLCVLG